MALATIDDLEVRLPAGTISDVTRATRLLDDASAAVVAYTGQSFSTETSTVRLKVRDGYVRLPQRPVSAVASVDDMKGNTLAHSWDHGDVVTIAGGDAPWASFSFEPIRTRHTYVDVTYTHGYDSVPADVIAVVCQMAARAYGQDATESGTVSETIDGYSYRLGSAAASGAFGMLPDERSVLNRYRAPGASILLH